MKTIGEITAKLTALEQLISNVQVKYARLFVDLNEMANEGIEGISTTPYATAEARDALTDVIKMTGVLLVTAKAVHNELAKFDARPKPESGGDNK